MYDGLPRSGFATQYCEANEGVVATPRSGGGDVRTRCVPIILFYLRMTVRCLNIW